MSGEVTNDDGGPAFPCDSTNKQFPTQCGMSLRDWFAGQAMMGIQASCEAKDWPGDAWLRDAARFAYMTADAMLKARSGK